MSKADEMFEKLGYENVRETAYWIVYKSKKKDIDFNVRFKTITAENGMECKDITIPETTSNK